MIVIILLHESGSCKRFYQVINLQCDWKLLDTIEIIGYHLYHWKPLNTIGYHCIPLDTIRYHWIPGYHRKPVYMNGRFRGDINGRFPGEMNSLCPGDMKGRFPGDMNGRFQGDINGRFPRDMNGRFPR